MLCVHGIAQLSEEVLLFLPSLKSRLSLRFWLRLWLRLRIGLRLRLSLRLRLRQRLKSSRRCEACRPEEGAVLLVLQSLRLRLSLRFWGTLWLKLRLRHLRLVCQTEAEAQKSESEIPSPFMAFMAFIIRRIIAKAFMAFMAAGWSTS